MNLAPKYLDAIANQDTLRLQMMLVTIIYSDEGFNTNRFLETIKAVKEAYPQIIVPHSGDLNVDKTQWNEAYYNKLLSELRDNFSQERINHVMEVGRYLYGKEEKSMNKVQATNVKTATEMQQNYKKGQSQVTNERRSSVKSVQNSGVSGKKTLPKVAIVGAAAMGVGAVIKESLPLMVGAVVLGGIGIYTLRVNKK